MSAQIKEYIKVFRQMCHPLNTEQIVHMKSLKSEYAVDAFARDVRNRIVF